MSNAQTNLASAVSLCLYPTRSMMGEDLNVVQFTERRVIGDRASALIDPDNCWKGISMRLFACFSISVFIAVALMRTHAVAQQNSGTESDSAVVARLVNDWAVALKTNDVKILERIMADDFVITNVDGSLNSKEQEIAPFRSSDLKFDTVSLQEVKITLYGTTAIVRGSGFFTGKSKWGSFSSKERFTDVYLKRNGKWQVVSSHSSSVKKK